MSFNKNKVIKLLMCMLGMCFLLSTVNITKASEDTQENDNNIQTNVSFVEDVVTGDDNQDESFTTNVEDEYDAQEEKIEIQEETEKEINEAMSKPALSAQAKGKLNVVKTKLSGYSTHGGVFRLFDSKKQSVLGWFIITGDGTGRWVDRYSPAEIKSFDENTFDYYPSSYYGRVATSVKTSDGKSHPWGRRNPGGSYWYLSTGDANTSLDAGTYYLQEYLTPMNQRYKLDTTFYKAVVSAGATTTVKLTNSELTDDVTTAQNTAKVEMDTTESLQAGGSKIHFIKVFDPEIQNAGTNAILVESDNHYALIDVGAPYMYHYKRETGTLNGLDSSNAVVNYLKNYGISHLDFVALTHFDNDHCGNMDMVLRTFDVDAVYARTYNHPDYTNAFPSRKSIAEICEEYDVPAKIIEDGQIFNFGSLTLKALNLDDELMLKENNNSVAFFIKDQYGHKTLLTGDLNNYDGDEDRLLSRYFNELKDLDFYEPGHHGGIGSNSYNFMKTLNPKIIVICGTGISKGKDAYRSGHTNEENYYNTRAYINKQMYCLFNSPTPNGIVANLGEEISINTSYISPSRSGDGNKTLSLYYNANGGTIDKSKSASYKLDKNKNVLSLTEDDMTWKDYVQQAKLKGDIAPMYYYDKSRYLEKMSDIGLVKYGYSFEGWLSEDNSKIFSEDNKYLPAEISPDIQNGNTTVTLYAKWEANPYYEDVNDTSKYYYTPVYWAASEGLTKTVVNFNPMSTCTRKDAMIFLYRLAGRPAVSETMPFKDMKNNYSTASDTYKSILWGYKMGIVNGYSDGTFRPDDGLERKDFILMLYRYAGKPSVSGKLSFTDVTNKYKSTTGTYKAILWAYNKGIARGYDSKTFKPEDLSIRADVITNIYRYAR